MAASTTAVIPIIVMFFFVQKQFVEGIIISG
jgi:multiple sugar transport system permease protein